MPGSCLVGAASTNAKAGPSLHAGKRQDRHKVVRQRSSMATDGTSPRATEPVFDERRKVIRLRSLSNPEIEVDVDFLSQQVYEAGRIWCARVAPVSKELTPRRSACTVPSRA